MNWLLLLVLLVLVFNVYMGYKKGLLRLVLSMVAWIAIIVIAVAWTPKMAEWISNNTSIEEKIQNKITSSDQADNELLEVTGVYDAAAKKISKFAINGLAFIGIILLGVLIYTFLNSILGIANKIPLLGGINRTAGGAFGFLKGCIIIWICFSFVGLNSESEMGELITSYIYDSKFLVAFYENNVVLSTLKSML